MSMIMRRGMMVPKAPGGLPDDYLRVQCIQGTGTQYIVTNLTGNIDREWIFDISDFNKNGNAYAPLFGIAVAGSNLGVYLASSSKVYTAFGNKGDITYNTTVSGWTNRFTLRQSKDGIYENDTHVLNAYLSLTYGSSDIPMAFPGRNGANGVEQITGAKIYGFVCKENGVVIADYVPCIRIADSTPGMYDLVGRQFYTNQGTGEFLVDTTPRFIQESAKWTNGGNVVSQNYTNATEIYYVAPTSSNRSLTYDKIENCFVIFKNGVFTDYWNKGTGKEKLNANCDGIAATISKDYIDDAYLIINGTGEIVFAGKNTQYYGYLNINNMPT